MNNGITSWAADVCPRLFSHLSFWYTWYEAWAQRRLEARPVHDLFLVSVTKNSGDFRSPKSECMYLKCMLSHYIHNMYICQEMRILK